MNSETGALAVASVLDYETSQTHTLTLAARDRKGESGYREDTMTLTVNVQVRESTPYFTAVTDERRKKMMS